MPVRVAFGSRGNFSRPMYKVVVLLFFLPAFACFPSFLRIAFLLAFSNSPWIFSQHHQVAIDNSMHGIDIRTIERYHIESMLRVFCRPGGIFRHQVPNERTPSFSLRIHLFPHPTILALIFNFLPRLTSPPVSIQSTVFVPLPPHVRPEDRSFPAFATWNR